MIRITLFDPAPCFLLDERRIPMNLFRQFLSRQVMFIMLGSLFLVILAAVGTVRSEVVIHSQEGRLRVEFDGELFTEYVYRGYSKPILYPIIGPHGIGMTRNYPMREDGEGEAKDHPHHQSLWFTHGQVNGVDFWSLQEGSGSIVQDELIETISGSCRGTIKTANSWLNSDGETVCTDRRSITFIVEQKTRMVDWTTTVYASHGDVVWGDTKEGSMGIRTHPRLRLKADPKRGVEVVAGHAVNSTGTRGKEIWGKRAQWVDYWGDIKGHVVGIAIFDHPKNLRHPTWWHARDYGLVAANPFGVHNFEGKPRGTGDLTLPSGESLTLRYRFVFHEGDPDQAEIKKRYNEFANEGIR
ncbi:MAG: hypothetical protein CMJ81_08250 [Planctomycetaceae bacterium]|nr:hypothetical protein [Planctomycetaceae bacterium]MBP61954.1 hypothetical protein [Planctomycetaceae bacterium]